MAFDDLDLEFEDEDEAKKKKNDAVHVDVDLSFHAHEAAAKTRTAINLEAIKASAPAPQARPQVAVVKKLDDARPPQVPVRKVAPSAPPVPRSVGSSALKEEPDYDMDGEEIVEMRERMHQMEVSSEIRVGIAEFKTEYITEIMSDMKLLDHQVNQLLIRINAKHPDMKKEVLMIKKLLADFTTKKRK